MEVIFIIASTLKFLKTMKTKIKSMADALKVIGVEPVEVKFERKKYRKFKFNKKG